MDPMYQSDLISGSKSNKTLKGELYQKGRKERSPFSSSAENPISHHESVDSRGLLAKSRRGNRRNEGWGETGTSVVQTSEKIGGGRFFQKHLVLLMHSKPWGDDAFWRLLQRGFWGKTGTAGDGASESVRSG